MFNGYRYFNKYYTHRYGKDLCPIDTNIVIDKKLLVCDIVYKPQDTVFSKWAKKNNLEIIYGIDMLINQALEALYMDRY
ncbi:MAG: hypothetical protein U0Z74_01185 [Romboutsia timonensis]